MTTEQEPTAGNNTLDYKYIGIILILTYIFLPELMINVLTAACYLIALISILSSCILLGTIFALIMASTSLEDNLKEFTNNDGKRLFQRKEKSPNRVISTADLD